VIKDLLNDMINNIIYDNIYIYAYINDEIVSNKFNTFNCKKIPKPDVTDRGRKKLIIFRKFTTNKQV
jgi:hypothetical protein